MLNISTHVRGHKLENVAFYHLFTAPIPTNSLVLRWFFPSHRMQ